MLGSLRTRLILSYILIIGLTLCIVAVALVLLLANSRIPAEQTYERLLAILRGSTASVDVPDEQIDIRLATVAEENDIRILRLNRERAVLFDSEGRFSAGEQLPLRALQTTDAPSDSPRIQRGTYREDNQVWLYVAFIPPPAWRDLGIIVLAEPRPRLSIFTTPASELLRPVIQAGIIGVILAVFFAVLISSSVGRPLRRTVDAANAMAGGDYGQQIPEKGPSELRDLARAFNEMSRQVQRTQETQRDFLANVTHELKTPLTSIQGYSQAILDGAAAEPSRAARVIYDEAGRMHRIVEDLLDLARIESGQAHFRREYVDLNDLLTSVLEHLALRAQEQRVTLSHQIATLPRLTGDHDRLSQVFTNLIDNALTHTPENGQISVRAEPSKNGIEVTVRDSGKGIPDDVVDRIFERFYQVDKARSRTARKGTGLGLTICKEIVEIHGGTICAESPPEGGALFTVWLPLPRPDDETVVDRTVPAR